MNDEMWYRLKRWNNWPLKESGAWWYMSVIPAAQEEEYGKSGGSQGN
jgi:hypothetical protein